MELSANGSATLTDDTIGGQIRQQGNDEESGGGIAIENASTSATSNLTLHGTTVTANNASAGTGAEGSSRSIPAARATTPT